jgi:Na+/citrate or Na+/malate symporter
MEPLLWLILIGRILRWAAPVVVGIVGAAVILSFCGTAFPARWMAILAFVVVACWLAGGVRDVLSGSRRDRGGRGDSPRQDL